MSGPQSTDRLFAILSRHKGLSVRRAVLRAVGPFPVAGRARWSNDWHVYRPCPYPHVHEGLDIFARRGTPVVATDNGVVTSVGANSVSGLAVTITNGTGTSYFYAHLSAYAAGARDGITVSVGDVLGYVGNTGDAQGGPTHVHFQVEPGGVPVPPKPFVDAWLLEAEQRAESVGRRGSVPPRTVPTVPLNLIRANGPYVVWAQPSAARAARPPRAATADHSSSLVGPAAMAGGTVAFGCLAVWVERRRWARRPRSGTAGWPQLPRRRRRARSARARVICWSPR